MGIAVSTARAGNVIGGGDFANDRIIPDCVRAAKNKETIIVRNPYSTRPYQHVLEPLAAYLMIAAKQYEDIKYADYYNVGPDECDCVTTGDLVTQAVGMLGYRTELKSGFDFGLRFTEDPAPVSWSAAGEIVVDFGFKTSTFTYDSAADSYTMVQYGQQFIDGNTGEAVPFANVIVISADTVTLDDYGRLGVTLTGSGSGHLYRNGKTADISWSRSAEGEPFVYNLSDGSTAELGVGRTFICVIPSGSGTVTVS